MTTLERPKTLDHLVALGAITQVQARIVIAQQQHLEEHAGQHRRVGELLLDNAFVTREVLRGALGKLGIGLTGDLQTLLPKDLCQRHQIVPLRRSEGKIYIEAARHLDAETISEIGFAATAYCGEEVAVEVVAAPVQHVRKGLKRLSTFNGVGTTLNDLVADPENGQLLKALIHEVFMEAAAAGASDCHFDWYHTMPERCWVSYRLDGVHTRMHLLPVRVMGAVLRTLKNQSGMDPVEASRHQDGRMDFVFESRRIDMRALSNAMDGGEYMTIRLLDRSNLRGLKDLYPFHPDITRELGNIVRVDGKESGVLLVTGPTGSGKTTTLYAAILAMPLYRLNVQTVEDPVEYDIPFVRQVQFIKGKYESFADVLPALLRSDPDVLGVGEMRDEDTAVSGLRYAEAGHLLLSSLHANDMWQSYDRFVNMMSPTTRHISVATFGQTIKGILNQTLERKLCPHCACEASDAVKQEATKWFGADVARVARVATEEGCEQCLEGFSGRICVPEAIFFSNSTEARSKLTRLLLDGKTLYEAWSANPALARAYPRRETLKPLIQAGVIDIHKALSRVGAERQQ